MMNHTLTLYQILVPCQFNDGRPVKTRHHKEWDKQVQKLTGGLTILPPSKGKWVDNNTQTEYHERMIPVNIATTPDIMQKIAAITVKHYDQEAVMYYVLSDRPCIVYKKYL